jgi:type II secretory ATPase GspE/PulE/Tfp pilus assembly ATPase PilB-like protein
MTTHLSGVSANIVTIEQAIESEIPGVRQTQLNAAAGLTSAAALRSILRQYPDVVMLSDIGEREAADMALRAAQSGILVLSTLTENDAASAVRRLVDMRLDPYLLASGLSAIVAQRLVRLICSECRERATYPADVLAHVGLAPDPDVLFSRGRGCAACGGTGYRGRTGAFEVVVPNDAVRMLIRQQADAGAIAQAAASARRNTVFDDAFAKAILQQTTLEEAVRLKATL